MAAGTGEMNYDRIIRFVKERKPYIHATLENTVPENAVASRKYIQRLWEECHGDRFLISTTWFGVPLIKLEKYFTESALADLFPAGVYDWGIDDRPDLYQHEAFGQ